MPTFSYTALKPSGERIRGELEASDRRQVVRDLFARNYRPVSIQQRAEGDLSREQESINFYRAEGKPGLLARLRENKPRIGQDFLAKMLEMLAAGMQIGDTVRLLSARLNDPRQKALAQRVWKDLSEGRTLASSLAQMPEYFSEATIHLIEAGESSGNLVSILEKLLAYMEENNALKARLISGLTYPIIIVFFAFIVVMVLVFFLLPQIRNMLETLGGEMQIFAQILIGGADFITSWGGLVSLGTLLAGALALWQWRRTTTGRRITDRWALRLPLLGNIFLQRNILESATLISTLMASGINTPEALRLTEKTIPNTQMRAKFNLCRTQIQEGVSMANVFRRTHFFPDLAVDLLTVGENTGNIVTALNDIARIYRRELTRSLSMLTNLVSTGALFFAFGLVALIALSIVLSVMEVTRSIQLG